MYSGALAYLNLVVGNIQHNLSAYWEHPTDPDASFYPSANTAKLANQCSPI